MIDTGEPRSVTGHAVSGAIASAVVAGSINYNNYNKDKITKEEAIQNSIKLTVQGGVATGLAIAATNYLGKGNYLGALAAITLGLGGVYAVEKVTEKIGKTKQIDEQIEKTGE